MGKKNYTFYAKRRITILKLFSFLVLFHCVMSGTSMYEYNSYTNELKLQSVFQISRTILQFEQQFESSFQLYFFQFLIFVLYKEYIMYHKRWIDVSTAAIVKDNNAKIKVFTLISWHEKNMFFNWRYKKRTQLLVCSYIHWHTRTHT